MSPHSSSPGNRMDTGARRLRSMGLQRSGTLREPLAPTKPVRGVGCSTAPACGPRLEETSCSEAAEPHAGPRELLLILPEYDTAGEIALCAPFSKILLVCPSEMEAAVKVTADGARSSSRLVVLMLFASCPMSTWLTSGQVPAA